MLLDLSEQNTLDRVRRFLLISRILAKIAFPLAGTWWGRFVLTESVPVTAGYPAFNFLHFQGLELLEGFREPILCWRTKTMWLPRNGVTIIFSKIGRLDWTHHFVGTLAHYLFDIWLLIDDVSAGCFIIPRSEGGEAIGGLFSSTLFWNLLRVFCVIILDWRIQLLRYFVGQTAIHLKTVFWRLFVYFRQRFAIGILLSNQYIADGHLRVESSRQIRGVVRHLLFLFYFLWLD